MNFHINRGDFLLKIRGGPWGGPWTQSMDRVHGVVHGPGPSGGPWTPVHALYTSIAGFPTALNSPVPIYTPGWRGHCES